MSQLPQTATDAVDWVVVGLSGLLFCSGLLGSLYVVTFSNPSQRPAAREFNYLWTTRLLSQVIVILLALSQLLRLQVLWGPGSVVIPGGFQPAMLCRIYTAVAFGLLEPAFLLLALFSCMYSVEGQKFSSHPNSNIIFFSAGFSLPTCAVQLVCALFTRILSTDYAVQLYHIFFSTYDTPGHCTQQSAEAAPLPSTAPTPSPQQTVVVSNCVFCTFPLFSTLTSVFFTLCYLLVAWHVTERIAAAVINKVLVRRIRWLQLLVATLLPLSLACRGLTVVFQPFDVGFELLRLGHAICTAGAVLSISFILVIKPVHDAHVTDNLLLLYHSKHDEWLGIAAVDAAGSGRRLAHVLEPCRLPSPQLDSLRQPSRSSSSRSCDAHDQDQDKAMAGGGLRQLLSTGSQHMPEQIPLVPRT